jgi:hypothetical protein
MCLYSSSSGHPYFQWSQSSINWYFSHFWDHAETLECLNQTPLAVFVIFRIYFNFTNTSNPLSLLLFCAVNILWYLSTRLLFELLLISSWTFYKQLWDVSKCFNGPWRTKQEPQWNRTQSLGLPARQLQQVIYYFWTSFTSLLKSLSCRYTQDTRCEDTAQTEAGIISWPMSCSQTVDMLFCLKEHFLF